MSSKKNYVALHTHSDFSLLDGFGKIEEYIKIAKDLNMIGLGLADHGTASGLYKFITESQKAGLIPVPGVEFYLAPENPEGAKRKGPIYYGPNGTRAPKYDVSKGAYTHITLFAYNNKGLENLMKLTSISWKPENFYFEPRIDIGMIAEYSEGLIATTGCPGSEVNRRFLLNQDDKAYEFASRLKNIFGENLYIEIMNHDMPKENMERMLIPKQIKLARDLDIKMIATNDSHYAYKQDAPAHEHILAMQTRSLMKDLPVSEGGTRFTFSGDEYYLKSYDEMLKVIPKEIAEEALANTEELTLKCKDISLDYDTHLRPNFEDIPEGHTPISFLQKLIYDGFVLKRGPQSAEIQEESVRRIKEEFEVIHSNDFITYFLVVQDYINYAINNGIGVGAGRGSVGGSETAYLLNISNTDPIRYDLLFERFLSPGRGSLYQIEYVSGDIEEAAVSDKKRVYRDINSPDIIYVHELYPGDVIDRGDSKDTVKNVFVKIPGSAPDVDTDFHTKGREDVIKYCVDKYGEEKVANIITFGTFKAKKAFKSMCTVYGVPFALANKITNFIPGEQGAEASLDDIMDPDSPRYNEGVDFRRAIEENGLETVANTARDITGRITEEGVHPCGVIISSKPLAGVIPTQVRQSDSKLICQWEYQELEALGLIKMDFLGLELIDTIQQTLLNIELSNSLDSKYKREIPNMNELIQGPMDDSETYKNLQEGNTVGIFQLGSPGVRELLKRSKPETFMDIASITALYRPGPMKSGSHIQYSNRKTGKEEISYIHPDFHGTEVENILKETFGLMIYQEQIMLIAGRYAGLTPYETDKLRKAIGKKKMSVMMEMKPKFVEGCMAKGASKKAIDELWDTIEVFGQYGFNKSHSVSYAINIYQSIYLKTHYPNEFMAALIQQGFKKPETLKAYIQEANRMGVKLGAVDINKSQAEISSTGANPNNKYNVVFGFNGISQMGTTLGPLIVQEREKNGKYKSVADFIERISKHTQLTKSALANLAYSGAFDCFDVSRKLVAEKAEMLIQSATSQKNKGPSMFALLGGADSLTESIEIQGEDLSYTEKIKKEASTLGFFVSGHPTSNLGHIAKRYNPKSIEEILAHNSKSASHNMVGTITAIKTKTGKKGNKSIAVLIDDGTDTFTTFLNNNIKAGLEKYELQEKIRIAKDTGTQLNISEAHKEILENPDINPIPPIEINAPYLFKAKTAFKGEELRINVLDIEQLITAPDGSLPFEVILPPSYKAKLNKVINKHKKENGAYLLIRDKTADGPYVISETRVNLSLDFIMDMEEALGKKNIITEGI